MKMKIIIVFQVWCNFVRYEWAYREIWACFPRQVGCKLNWPLPQTKSAVIFRKYFAVNPFSLYLGSCWFGLWLPSTPQFGDFIAYHNFCFVILIMLRFFKVDKIFCMLRHLNDKWAYPPQRRRHIPFVDMPSFRGAVDPNNPLLSAPGALTETPVRMGPQTCWKSCGTLPWRSWTFVVALKFRPLRGRSCAAPAGPI